ncbi:endonuclease/exonuclease/phosphatase family protein [Streptomyces syringium]|uniref:endonuclease/exonuclease/phosphatase family protein n=1 Tax=Streptomyces syringium TaxID=76729 RepID=UPI0034559FDE
MPRPIRTALQIVCATALAGAAILVAARATSWDDGTWLAMPMAGFPYAVVGTVVVLVVLLVLRSWWVAAVAAVLVVTELAWTVPRFVPDREPVSASAPRLRVATSNAHVGAVDPEVLVRLVRAERLDVLAMEEMTPQAIAALDKAGMAELMPYRELHPESDSSLYSRLPLTGGGLLRGRATVWPQTTAAVKVGGRTVRLVAVHTLYPLGDARRWAHDMRELREEAVDSGRDTVFLGDFNATLDHAPMRRLLSAGLTDSHAELGRGWAPTWPADASGVPSLLQLDHVLHGSGLAAVSVSEHVVRGSDHKAVVAELALVD